MSEIFAERPSYFEGQYLAADDLAALVDYSRIAAARHALGAHTWGIVTGLDLVEVKAKAGAVDVYLLPGYAIDGFGRAVVVLEPCKLPTDLFAQMGTDNVPVWIRYDETPWRAARTGFQACCAHDDFARVGETYAIEAGVRDSVLDRQSRLVIAGEGVTDAREARRLFEDDGPLQCDGSVPHQALPPPEDAGRWLIPLGIVSWQSGAPGHFVALTDAQKLLARRLRRQAGAVAEGMYAANGVIRLRNRFTRFDDAKTTDQQCEADQVGEGDVRYCAATDDKPAHLEFRELIWLEGRVRITGDTRLFGARLEFRDDQGTPYVKDNGDPDSTPLFMHRATDPNELGGHDLRIAIGQSTGGLNRLVVGQVTATQKKTDPCVTDFAFRGRVAFQDDGRVGIGTFGPISELEVPLTVRGTGDEGDLAGFEDKDGQRLWQMSLGSALTGLSFVETGPAESRLYIEKGGDVGIGTETPEAKLDITQVRATEDGAKLGKEMWLRAGNGDETGRFWVENGQQGAPRIVLSGKAHPPRIQFQQVAKGEEDKPDYVSWIGHAEDKSGNLAVMGGQLGVSTLSPYANLTVEGSLGFTNSSEPAIYLWESGSQNPERMVIAHSPDRDEWGLSFRDVGNLMIFKGEGPHILSVDLQNERVGIGTDDPKAELDIRGDIKLGASGDHFALRGQEKLLVVAGRVDVDGTILAGEGFIVSNATPGNGNYLIMFTVPFAAIPVVVASPMDGDELNLVTVRDLSNLTFNLKSRKATPEDQGEETPSDVGFTFVALGLPA